ncbi:ABC-2 type transport system permease protein [Agreia bicolorata]|uniref:ABC-2 type transport system permease protein n=1 Tax=Agreia bicolorata TaxID=110935 RepID=A0A1T4YAS5_9MICO|nr:ABC transporter permease subunit [Agreia bicolorata]SKA98917.1 ABC-2 type transport system permease protein [Agreia bicolorata]
MSSSELGNIPVRSGVTERRIRRSIGVGFFASELAVLFRRRRTWAMLLALAAVPVLIAVAVRISSGSSGRGPAFIDSITQNGLFVGIAGLTIAIPLFLPLTVGVVSGDSIAGEANAATLRYLLVSPVGRIRLLVVKYLAAAVFCLAATLTLSIAGVLIGIALFPVGPVTLLSGDTVSIGGALVRSLLIALYATVSLLGLSAIGLFISTLTDAPVGAMAATVVLSIVAQVLDSLSQTEWLHPWLFSHYWLNFADLLRQPIEWSSFGQNALLQLGYVVVFGALAYGRFSSKDILS